ncbi:hypothetical protein [Hydrogenophaga sp.]|uniref:hypothetical protein n=1 Tax=Hydrogenophaga sp. TaxID=1904254 RepID=UPI002FC83F9E
MSDFYDHALLNLEAARQDFPPGAVAYIKGEIAARCDALNLCCVAVDFQSREHHVEGTASFDLNNDEGQPLQAVFRAPLVTVH